MYKILKWFGQWRLELLAREEMLAETRNFKVICSYRVLVEDNIVYYFIL